MDWLGLGIIGVNVFYLEELVILCIMVFVVLLFLSVNFVVVRWKVFFFIVLWNVLLKKLMFGIFVVFVKVVFCFCGRGVVKFYFFLKSRISGFIVVVFFFI